MIMDHNSIELEAVVVVSDAVLPLTHSKATHAFIQACEEVLAARRCDIMHLSAPRETTGTGLTNKVVGNITLAYWCRLDVIVTLVFACALLGISIAFIDSPVSAGMPLYGLLVESLLLISVLVWNSWLFVHESRMEILEMSNRIQRMLDSVLLNGISDASDFKFPSNIPSVSVSRVLRDAAIKTLPSSLLVTNDLLLLALGDVAPCRCKLVVSNKNDASTPYDVFVAASRSSMTGKAGGKSNEYNDALILEANTVLKPEIISRAFSSPDSKPIGQIESFGVIPQGLFCFIALETPITQVLIAALDHKRPLTVIAIQLAKIDRLFTSRVLLVLLAIAFLVNLLRYFVILRVSPANVLFALEMLINLQIYLLIPLLPLALPSLSLVARAYGNAQILCLFEALQTSTAAFQDAGGVDEFDAAPAPVKQVSITWKAIWRKFVDQIIGNYHHAFLARTTGLVESLANTTVICSIDREGTIAAPLPSMDQLFFLQEDGDPIVLDVSENRLAPNGMVFEDKDWETHLPLLKPIGLNQLLCAECGVRSGRKRNDIHLKNQFVGANGTLLPACEICLCSIGREIGFSLATMQQFSSKALIRSISPFHSTVKQCAYDYHFEIPTMTSKLFVDDASGSYQLFSDGNIDMVLESCGDYWNGSGLGAMNDAVERKIAEFFTNAFFADMQVVGYSYRPIQTLPTFIENTNNRDSPNLSNGVSFEYLIIPEPPGDTVDRSGAANEALESPGFAVKSPDLDIIPTPLPLPVHTDFAANSTSFSIDSYDPTISRSAPNRNDSMYTTGSNFGTNKNKKRSNRSRVVSKIDAEELGEDITPSNFYSESIKGQTFLGMAAFIYRPKPNVIDFIEDLALAGIRFVYFSQAPEQESKAYAERLGLEIDWNSCILLSPEGMGSGYLAIHDMKAKLPKGVDTIRAHIEHVDDVPLHVSLFAECEPYSVREMMRIFQEHGEVVCCVGSSLNALNVETFAMADISISVDPLHISRNRASDKENKKCPLSPLAVASGFNSCPCALTLGIETSLYTITQIIREARTLTWNARQGFTFYVGAQMGLCATILLSYCFLQAPIYMGYQLIFVNWIILPLISVSFLFTPHLSDVMTSMPVKNTDHLKDLSRFVVYIVIRFMIIPAFLIVVTFGFVLCHLESLLLNTASSGSEVANPGTCFGTFWSRFDQIDRSALLFSQNFVLYLYVVYMLFISATFLFRCDSVLKQPPFKNRTWITMSVVTLLCQAAFYATSCIGTPFSLGDVPYWIYVLNVVGLLLLVPVQEAVKMHDRHEWVRFQKRSKLEFNTKLGMHSPI